MRLRVVNVGRENKKGKHTSEVDIKRLRKVLKRQGRRTVTWLPQGVHTTAVSAQVIKRRDSKYLTS